MADGQQRPVVHTDGASRPARPASATAAPAATSPAAPSNPGDTARRARPVSAQQPRPLAAGATSAAPSQKRDAASAFSPAPSFNPPPTGTRERTAEQHAAEIAKQAARAARFKPKVFTSSDEDDTEEGGGDYEGREEGVPAKAIVGTCESMCPVKEFESRTLKNEFSIFEREFPSDKNSKPSFAIKQSVRNHDEKGALKKNRFRTMDALLQTTARLRAVMDMDMPKRSREIHGFCWDKQREVRKEIRMQHFDTKKETMGKVIRITEESVRFLLAASHPLLADPQFVQALSQEQMSKAVSDVLNQYKTAARLGVETPCSAEIKCYSRLMTYGGMPNKAGHHIDNKLDTEEQNRMMTQEELESPWTLVSNAMTHSLSVGNTATFLRLAQEAPYVLACVANHQFKHLRLFLIRTLHACSSAAMSVRAETLASALHLPEDLAVDLSCSCNCRVEVTCSGQRDIFFPTGDKFSYVKTAHVPELWISEKLKLARMSSHSSIPGQLSKALLELAVKSLMPTTQPQNTYSVPTSIRNNLMLMHAVSLSDGANAVAAIEASHGVSAGAYSALAGRLSSFTRLPADVTAAVAINDFSRPSSPTSSFDSEEEGVADSATDIGWMWDRREDWNASVASKAMESPSKAAFSMNDACKAAVAKLKDIPVRAQGQAAAQGQAPPHASKRSYASMPKVVVNNPRSGPVLAAGLEQEVVTAGDMMLPEAANRLMQEGAVLQAVGTEDSARTGLPGEGRDHANQKPSMLNNNAQSAGQTASANSLTGAASDQQLAIATAAPLDLTQPPLAGQLGSRFKIAGKFPGRDTRQPSAAVESPSSASQGPKNTNDLLAASRSSAGPKALLTKSEAGAPAVASSEGGKKLTSGDRKPGEPLRFKYLIEGMRRSDSITAEAGAQAVSQAATVNTAVYGTEVASGATQSQGSGQPTLDSYGTVDTSIKRQVAAITDVPTRRQGAAIGRLSMDTESGPGQYGSWTAEDGTVDNGGSMGPPSQKIGSKRSLLNSIKGSGSTDDEAASYGGNAPDLASGNYYQSQRTYEASGQVPNDEADEGTNVRGYGGPQYRNVNAPRSMLGPESGGPNAPTNWTQTFAGGSIIDNGLPGNDKGEQTQLGEALQESQQQGLPGSVYPQLYVASKVAAKPQANMVSGGARGASAVATGGVTDGEAGTNAADSSISGGNTSDMSVSRDTQSQLNSDIGHMGLEQELGVVGTPVVNAILPQVYVIGPRKAVPLGSTFNTPVETNKGPAIEIQCNGVRTLFLLTNKYVLWDNRIISPKEFLAAIKHAPSRDFYQLVKYVNPTGELQGNVKAWSAEWEKGKEARWW